MIVLRSPNAHVATQLSSIVHGAGNLLASTGPLLTGLIQGWAGGWGAVFVLCCVLVGILVPAGIAAGQAAARPRGFDARKTSSLTLVSFG
jgi:CP family cyanate transporter-like MFS transporter